MQTNHQREITNLERKHEVSECIIYITNDWARPQGALQFSQLKGKGAGDDFDQFQLSLLLRRETRLYSTHVTYECLAPFQYKNTLENKHTT